MRGTPWEPEPGRIGIEVPVQLRAWEDIEIANGPRIPDGVEPVRGTNRQWITRYDVEHRYGPTPGCRGCEYVLTGLHGNRGHSEECRERFEKLWIEQGDIRIAREAERLARQEQHDIRTRLNPESAPEAENETIALDDPYEDGESMVPPVSDNPNDMEEDGSTQLGSDDDDDDDVASDNMLFRLDLSPDSEELWRSLNSQLKTRT